MHKFPSTCTDGRRSPPLKGRPPKEFSDEQVIEMGEELLAFLKDRLISKDPVVHLTEWYSIIKDLTFGQWDALCTRKEFLPYYDSALDLMALSTQKNPKLETAYGSRFLGLYSKNLRWHEKLLKEEQADLDKKVKQAEAQIVGEEERRHNERTMQAFLDNQEKTKRIKELEDKLASLQERTSKE